VILTAGSFGPAVRYEATSRPRSDSSTHVDLILAGFLHYYASAASSTGQT